MTKRPKYIIQFKLQDGRTAWDAGCAQVTHDRSEAKVYRTENSAARAHDAWYNWSGAKWVTVEEA